MKPHRSGGRPLGPLQKVMRPGLLIFTNLDGRWMGGVNGSLGRRQKNNPRLPDLESGLRGACSYMGSASFSSSPPSLLSCPVSLHCPGLSHTRLEDPSLFLFPIRSLASLRSEANPRPSLSPSLPFGRLVRETALSWSSTPCRIEFGAYSKISRALPVFCPLLHPSTSHPSSPGKPRALVPGRFVPSVTLGQSSTLVHATI